MSNAFVRFRMIAQENNCLSMLVWFVLIISEFLSVYEVGAAGKISACQPEICPTPSVERDVKSLV